MRWSLVLILIGVLEAQLRFVTNTSSGMVLMKCGNVVIPFDNTIETGDRKTVDNVADA